MSKFSKTVTFSSLSLNRREINGDLRGATNTTMLTLIGNPRGTYSDDCRFPTNLSVSRLMVEEKIDHISVTGLNKAVESLRSVFSEIKRDHPEIYEVMGSAGMLCCRLVRGSKTSISNHSWGTAIDLTIEGAVDKRGDDRVQVALLEIYKIFNKHQFFWGAAFPVEDSMHFEASDQLIRKWAKEGAFGSSVQTAPPVYLSIGDRSHDVEKLQFHLNRVLGIDLDLDGIFGKDTRAAVIEFQRMLRVPVDGVAAPDLLEKLMKYR